MPRRGSSSGFVLGWGASQVPPTPLCVTFWPKGTLYCAASAPADAPADKAATPQSSRSLLKFAIFPLIIQRDGDATEI